MANRILIIIAFLSFSIAYVAYEAHKLDSKLDEYAQSQSTDMVSKLPNLVFNYFENPDKKFDLIESAERGNHLFVHFWATWCGPCETELPELMQLTELMKTRKNVKFLLVTVNDEVKKVKKFLKKFNKFSNFVVLVDNDFYYQKYFNTFKLPETFLFSSNKTLFKKFVGPQQWTQRHFVDTLNSL